jgi:CDP-glucose 4,6-dehydratase
VEGSKAPVENMEIAFADKTIIVTGGAGFIGGNLVAELVRQKARVIVVDIQNDPNSLFSINKLNKKAIFKKTDIRNKKELLKIFKEYDPDFIFHLAAITIVPYAYSNPLETFESNLMGTVNILESAREIKNLKAIIVASSDKSYGKLNKKKYLETDALKGDHPYDVSKSCTDLISESYFVTYNLPVTISRFGNVYGEGDINFSRIIPDAIKSIIENKTLEIRSNGKYIRDYLYVKDVIEGYLNLAQNIEKTKGEAFNFGSNETLSVFDVLKIIEKTLKRKIPYKIINTAINEIPYQSLDYAKVRKQLGWEPRFTMEKVLPNIFNFYKKILKA